jgi:cyclopropane-fatty-acyl-phospholipid synthase
VVSIGFTEHVGPKNYRSFMELGYCCLKREGLFLLHTIGTNRTLPVSDARFRKYIFPHGHLPSIRQLGKAMEPFFVMEDWHNFEADYDRALMPWYENFQAHRKELKSTYEERFYRMWTYYLLSCAGAFRARTAQLWQIVLSKERLGVYQAVR